MNQHTDVLNNGELSVFMPSIYIILLQFPLQTAKPYHCWLKVANDLVQYSSMIICTSN
jgi:hypothetical protein